jgi:hypothetical protein
MTGAFKKTQLLSAFPVLIGAALLFFAVLISGGAPKTDTPPKISWAPSSLDATVSAGASKTFTLSFVPSGDASNVILRVVPELQPFVQVTPAVFQSLPSGKAVPVTVTVAIPATTTPQTIKGTIQLRRADGNNGNIAAPLPVTLKTVWTPFSDAQTGVQMSYPDFGATSQVEIIHSDDVTRFLVSFQTGGGNSNVVSEFNLFLSSNTNHLSLPDWFHQNIDPDGTLISSGAFADTTLSNGAHAFVRSGPLPEDFGPVNSIYGISESGNTIVSLTPSQDNNLSQYGLTRNQVYQMLLEILTTLKTP